MKTEKMKKIAAVVLALMMTVLCLTACGGSDGDKITVTIVDGNTKTEVQAKPGDRIADILKGADITLGAKDTVEPAADKELAEGVTVITVKRAAAAAGSTETAKATEAPTEAQAKEEFNEEFKEEKTTESIPYSTEEEYSDAIPEGDSEVTQYGAEGEKEITYRVKYVNGKEESREKISEKVTKEPVNEIITYGTGSVSGGDERYEVSRQNYPDCDGSGHGYYEILYSDGSTEYEEY